MTAAVAEDLAQIPMSPFLAATLERAAGYADAQSHQEVTLEHVLLALAEDPEASVILKSSDVDIARLQTDVSNFLGNISARQDSDNPQPVRTSQELQHILEAAAEAARQGQRQEINGAILLAAIVGDGTSSAAHILRAQGLTFDATIAALRDAVQPPSQQPSSPVVSEAPHQRPSPQPAAPAPVSPPPTDPLADARRKVDQTLRPEPRSRSPESEVTVEPQWEPAVRPEPPPPTPEAAPSSLPPAPSTSGETGPGSHEAAAAGQWAPVQPAAKPDRSATPRLQRVPPPLPPDAGLRPPRSEGGGARHDLPATPQRDTEPAWTRGSGSAGQASQPPPRLPDSRGFGPGAHVPPWIGETAVRQSGVAPAPGTTAPGGVQRPSATPLQPRSTQIKVETGQLVENIPRKMKAGITQLVEVRIARANVKALAQGLQGGGTAVRHDALITKAMSVKLRAPDGGFWVEAASPETQWIDNVLGVMTDDFASWRWSVTPKAAGRKKLQLVVSARTVGSDGLAAETALPDQLYTVKVSVNYKRSTKRVLGWLLAAVLGGVLARFGEDAWQAIKTLISSGGLG